MWLKCNSNVLVVSTSCALPTWCITPRSSTSLTFSCFRARFLSAARTSASLTVSTGDVWRCWAVGAAGQTVVVCFSVPTAVKMPPRLRKSPSPPSTRPLAQQPPLSLCPPPPLPPPLCRHLPQLHPPLQPPQGEWRTGRCPKDLSGNKKTLRLHKT